MKGFCFLKSDFSKQLDAMNFTIVTIRKNSQACCFATK